MRIVCIIVLLLLASGCENEVAIHSPGDPEPVAYCLLDVEDSIQRISLSLTYLPVYGDMETGTENGYFEKLKSHSALIEKWENGMLRDTYSFDHTDLVDHPGYSIPNSRLILESQFQVHHETNYVIRVFNSQDNEIIRGDTKVVGLLKVLDPILVPGRELTLTLDQGYFLRWEPVKYARAYQPIVYFNYLESDSGIIESRKLKIPLRVNINSEQIHAITQFMSGRHFIMAIRDGIPYIPGIRRKAVGLDFEILVGGEELSIYIEQGISGTSDFGQLKDYSNYDQAQGIFSSRSSTWIKGVNLSYITHDSLSVGLYTRQLGFISSKEEL